MYVRALFFAAVLELGLSKKEGYSKIRKNMPVIGRDGALTGCGGLRVKELLKPERTWQ